MFKAVSYTHLDVYKRQVVDYIQRSGLRTDPWPAPDLTTILCYSTLLNKRGHNPSSNHLPSTEYIWVCRTTA